MEKVESFVNEFHGHINIIKKANLNNTLAVFIGAGISKTFAIGINILPDWSQLINDIKSELDYLKEQDFLIIAQLYFLKFGPYRYFDKIKSYFPDNIEPSIIHDMIFELSPQIIITTNWDNVFENAVRKHGFLYDIIASDQELVKSTMPKKIIKMHGDFMHDNFVFKEEDYINYSDNFPLLENYIKGILTTHTVIFLGYSFNDIDIKHIIRWLQNRSKYRPPMYMAICDSEENKSQIKYLESYHIKTLLLKDSSTELTDEYDLKTKKLFYFLKTLYQKEIIYQSMSYDDVIDFIHNKLIVFKDLQSILFRQIQSVLTNCRILFRHGLPILMFYNNNLSLENTNNIRSVYQKFVVILDNCCKDGDYKSIKQQEKLIDILDIFYRSGIKGILLSDETDDPIKYFDMDLCFSELKFDFTEKIINFNFNEEIDDISSPVQKMTEKVFVLYQKEKYEEIVPILNIIITQCRTNKFWNLLLIAMLNKNIIVGALKMHYQNNHKYDNEKEYDLKYEYEKLPSEIQSMISPIYFFLELNDLYRLYFSTSRDLSIKEGHLETIRKGGMVYGSDGGKNYFQQENLLYFVINNKIMIEDYTEYKEINRNFFSISLTEQALNENIRMNRIQLFAAIKYSKNQDLISMLKYCYDKTSEYKQLIICDEDKKWLVDDVYLNLSNYYISNDFDSSVFENYLLNSLFFLSIINFEKSIIKFILSKFLDFIKRPKNSIYIYRGINSFFGSQYKLFSTEIDPDYFSQILELVIRKIINREWSGFDHLSLAGGSLGNVFLYAKKQHTIYRNENDIKQLIIELSNFSDKEKMEIISSILLNIYYIGTDEIRNTIKEFVLSIDNNINIDDNKPDEYLTGEELLQQAEERINIGSKIIFELNLTLIGLKTLSEPVIANIEKYIDKYEYGKFYDSYMVLAIELIPIIYNRLQDATLENLNKRALSIIENRRNRKFI